MALVVTTEIPVRRVLWLVAAWLLVVATGSWLVWTVISDVGEERRPGLAVPVRPGQTPVASPGEDRADPTPTAAPSPSRTASTTAPATAPATTPASVSPSRSTPSAGADRGATGGSATTRTLTWTGAAGVVTTRCTGARIELVGASASADGYVVEVDDRGPTRVRVEFEGRGDETVPETRVEARCVAGEPSYDVRSGD